MLLILRVRLPLKILEKVEVVNASIIVNIVVNKPITKRDVGILLVVNLGIVLNAVILW